MNVYAVKVYVVDVKCANNHKTSTECTQEELVHKRFVCPICKQEATVVHAIRGN